MTKLVFTPAPAIMGVLNVTPDSFSDGGQHLTVAAAVDRAAVMCEEGADMLDIGGESTRPGAAAVGIQQELDRVLPVIDALNDRFDVALSIDTSKPAVMTAAAAAGASLINDVRALREPGAASAAAATGLPVCLMHMQGQPRTMQHEPRYGDVVAEVFAFLDERIAAAQTAGIPVDRIIVDPGIGFGKTLDHNIELLAALSRLVKRGQPVLLGVSRKSMFAKLLGRPVDQRLAGGLAVATYATQAGVSILRVHDVAATVDAVRVMRAIRAVAENMDDAGP